MNLRFLILIAALLILNCERERLPFELKEERWFSAGEFYPMDVNRDGIDELFVVRYYHMAPLNQKGGFVWDYYFPDPMLKITKCATVFDFNQDGLKEIFLNYSEGLTQIIECYGSVKGGDLIKRLRTVTVEDRNKDGRWDGVVQAVGSLDANDDGKFDLLLRSNCGFDLQPRGLVTYDMNTGKEIWHYWTGPQIYDVILEDLNQDKKPEIVLGTYSPANGSEANNTVDWESYVIVLDRKGKLTWRKKTGEYFTQTLVAVSDIDGDGKKEIITALSSRRETKEPDKLLILDGETGRQEKLIATGETFWGLACADLNYDGKDEILTGNSDGKIRVFNSDLDEIKSFQNNTGIDLMGVDDLNGDGRKEIITNTEDGKLIIFNEKLKKTAQLKLEKNILHGKFGEGYDCVIKPVRAHKEKKLLIPFPKGDEFEFVLYSFVPVAFAGEKGILPIALLIIAIVLLSYLYARKTIIPELQLPSRDLLRKSKEGYIILNKRGKVLFANETAERVLELRELEGSEFEKRLKEKGIALTLPLPSRERKFQEEEGQIIINPPEGEKILSFKTSRVKQGFLLRIEDITKTEHLKRIEGWAPVAQKLAHGIKTPLMNIQLSIQQLETVCEPVKEKTEKLIEGVKAETKRLRKLTDAFMRFTQLAPPNLVAENINEILKELGGKYSLSIPEKIKIEYDLADDTPKILIDRKEIENALSVIIDNAIEAMGKEGTLTIATSLQEKFEGRIKNWVRIEITDTGKGIPGKYLNEVFKPYFTYEKPEGTGLGLTLAKRIIESHNGQIEIQSKEGVGTTVLIYLPG